MIPNQCEYDEIDDIQCQYGDRLCRNNEIYKFSEHHDDLDMIEFYNLNANNIQYASLDEIQEITLQNYLDIIHCNLLHDMLSNGDKYIPKIPDNYILNEDEYIDKSGIVDIGNYEFAVFFNCRSTKNDHYCCPKYNVLKTELLENNLYKISLNDYNILIEQQLWIIYNANMENV